MSAFHAISRNGAFLVKNMSVFFFQLFAANRTQPENKRIFNPFALSIHKRNISILI